MCEVGARCASSARKTLETAQQKLTENEQSLAATQSPEEIQKLQKENTVLVENVKKAQLVFDGTKSGLKELANAGYSIGQPRYDRARMQNVFSRAVLDRKKRTGQARPEKHFFLQAA